MYMDSKLHVWSLLKHQQLKKNARTSHWRKQVNFLRRTMVLDGGIQRIGRPFTETLTEIEGRFHQKIMTIGFPSCVMCCQGILSLNRSLIDSNVSAAFIVRNVFLGHIAEVFIKVLAKMTLKSLSSLRSKLSHRQGRKQGKYLQGY
jgi:hypothetical protein